MLEASPPVVKEVASSVCELGRSFFNRTSDLRHDIGFGESYIFRSQRYRTRTRDDSRPGIDRFFYACMVGIAKELGCSEEGEMRRHPNFLDPYHV